MNFKKIDTNMEWKKGITLWIIIIIRYSGLFLVYQQKHKALTDNPLIRINFKKTKVLGKTKTAKV